MPGGALPLLPHWTRRHCILTVRQKTINIELSLFLHWRGFSWTPGVLPPAEEVGEFKSLTDFEGTDARTITLATVNDAETLFLHFLGSKTPKEMQILNSSLSVRGGLVTVCDSIANKDGWFGIGGIACDNDAIVLIVHFSHEIPSKAIGEHNDPSKWWIVQWTKNKCQQWKIKQMNRVGGVFTLDISGALWN